MTRLCPVHYWLYVSTWFCCVSVRAGLSAYRTLPASPAKVPPSGPGWIHEIKHDGFRIMARRDAAGVRLITRNGNDFTRRFPLSRERPWPRCRDGLA